MAASNFDGALARVLKHEGGYVDHAEDPGGATNLGVTIGTLSAHLGRPATKGEVRALTPAAVAPIYRARYWQAVHADELPPGVDFCVFDFAVNSGPGRGVMALQRAVGVADDGRIGPVTLAAARQADPATTVERICDDRLAFLRRLSTWPTFGRGWQRRVDEVRVQSLDLVHAAMRPGAPVRPTLPVPPSGGSGVKPAAPTTIVVVERPAPALPTQPAPAPGFWATVLARLRAGYPPEGRP